MDITLNSDEKILRRGAAWRPGMGGFEAPVKQKLGDGARRWVNVGGDDMTLESAEVWATPRANAVRLRGEALRPADFAAEIGDGFAATCELFEREGFDDQSLQLVFEGVGHGWIAGDSRETRGAWQPSGPAAARDGLRPADRPDWPRAPLGGRRCPECALPRTGADLPLLPM